MKLTSVKAMVAKVMTVGFLAGAVAMMAPAKAQAQGFAVGVRVGNPYYGYGYAPRRDYAFERREAFIRHDEWVRYHRFHDRFYR